MKNDESLADLRSEVKHLKEENEQLREDVQSYVMLVNNKDRYAINLERELKKYQDLAAHYQEQIQGCEEQMNDYQNQITYYQNLRVVKGYFRLRHFAGRVKRKIKKILGKQ